MEGIISLLPRLEINTIANVRNCSFVFRREKRNGKRGIAFERYSIIPKQIDISSDCVYRLVKS